MGKYMYTNTKYEYRLSFMNICDQGKPAETLSKLTTEYIKSNVQTNYFFLICFLLTFSASVRSKNESTFNKYNIRKSRYLRRNIL